MKSIKELVVTPSAALQFMVDGLLKQSKRSNFKIDMDTFGSTFNGICYGCAATCTLQQIAGKNYTPKKRMSDSKERSKIFGFESFGDFEELSRFEDSIDYARNGYIEEVFSFFGIGSKFKETYNNRFCLEDDNWRKQLPLVKKLIEDLKSDGV